MSHGLGDTTARFSHPGSVTNLRYHGDQAARGAQYDFAVNVRDSAPEWLRNAIIAGVAELTAYPDAQLDAYVREAIGEIHHRPADEVLLLSGVAEGFSLLPNLGLTPTILYPQFTEPEAAFDAVGKQVRRELIPWPFELDDATFTRLAQSPSADYASAHTATSAAGGTKPHQMIIVGNPTNPTGVLHSRQAIMRLTELAEVVVVDEAFMDVAQQCEAVTVAGQRCRELLVFRSMTKTWSIAGLRCGYVVGDRDILAALARSRPHWPVGTLQLRAMQAIAEHARRELPQIRSDIERAREEMAAMLRAAGWSVHPSQGPFLLVQPPLAPASPTHAPGTEAECPGATSRKGTHAHRTSMSETVDWGIDRGVDTERVRQALADRGIAVRRCDTFPGLDSTYWRLAVRNTAEVGTLVANVREIIADFRCP